MKKSDNVNRDETARRAGKRRAFEGTATFGLLLLAIGLVAPFTSIDSPALAGIFKWVFGAGALIYTVARIVGCTGKDESLRIRRLRRMEVWAGIAFCVASFFWFYNAARMEYGMYLMAMRDTVVFTLAGAVIQIIASWMIAARMKKEQSGPNSGNNPDRK